MQLDEKATVSRLLVVHGCIALSAVLSGNLLQLLVLRHDLECSRFLQRTPASDLSGCLSDSTSCSSAGRATLQ